MAINRQDAELESLKQACQVESLEVVPKAQEVRDGIVNATLRVRFEKLIPWILISFVSFGTSKPVTYQNAQ